MQWTLKRADQWEGVDGSWEGRVMRLTGQITWSAFVYLTILPSHRREQHGFVDDVAARTWCETESKRLSEEARR